jgi:hypothetical protein
MSLRRIVGALLGQGALEKLIDLRTKARVAAAPFQTSLVRQRLKRQRVSVGSLAKPKQGFTIFFAPEAGIAPHFVSHCILARTLQDAGHPVLVAGCFDLFPRCIVLDAAGRPKHTANQRAAACIECGKNSGDFTASYELNSFDLAELVSPQDRTQIDSLLANCPNDLREFSLDGIAFGKIAGAEASVTLKTLDFSGQTPQAREMLIQYLRGALLSYFAIKKLIQTIPIARLVYFSEYSMMLGAAMAAQRADIPISNMSHAHVMTTNRQMPTLHSHSIALLSYRYMLQNWQQWRDLSLPPARVDQIFADSMFRFMSDNVMVYSRSHSGATDDLFRRLALSDSKPILVAFTSSLDEIYANKLMLEAVGGDPFSVEQPFAHQIEWLGYLIGQAESQERFQLIIRIHPREGGNRREAVSSEHLKMLRQAFDKPYRSVRIVWPEDSVSSYDLMEMADAATSSWSSTALEMARLGAPTVLAFQNYTPMPLGDVVAWGRTPESYLEAIDWALATPPSLERVRFATRWMNMRMFANSIDLSDIIPSPQFGGLPAYHPPAATSIIEDVLIRGEMPLAINLEMLHKTQTDDSLAAETEALLRNLRKSAWALSFGKAPERDYRLHDGAVAELPAGVDVAAWRDDGFMIFRTRDQIVRRRSRLVERLVRLSAQSRG